MCDHEDLYRRANAGLPYTHDLDLKTFTPEEKDELQETLERNALDLAMDYYKSGTSVLRDQTYLTLEDLRELRELANAERPASEPPTGVPDRCGEPHHPAPHAPENGACG